MLLRMQIDDELQKELFFFNTLERTIFKFYTETRGYELLSAYDAVCWSIRFKWVSDAASRCVINRRSMIWLAAVKPPLQVSAYLAMGNIPGFGKIFRSETERNWNILGYGARLTVKASEVFFL